MEQLTKWAFREKLQLILEKKGKKAEYDFVDDALNLEDGHKAYIDTFYKLYLQGKSIEEISDLVFTLKEDVKKLDESSQQTDNIYPLIKNQQELVGMMQKVEQYKKTPVTIDAPEMPVIYALAPEDNLYMICAIDMGSGLAFFSNNNLNDYKFDRKKLYETAIINLKRKVNELIKQEKITVKKEAEGVHSFFVSDNLAGSLILMANDLFEYIKEKIGEKEAAFVYAITVNTDQLLVLSSKIEQGKVIGFTMGPIRELQTKVAHPILLDPLIINKDGFGILRVKKDARTTSPPTAPQQPPATPPK